MKKFISLFLLISASSCLPEREELNPCGVVVGYSGQQVTMNTARLKGEITVVGEIDSVGFELSETPNFGAGTIKKWYKAFLGGKPDTFDILISGLQPSKTYFYYSKAKSVRKICVTESQRLELKTPSF